MNPKRPNLDLTKPFRDRAGNAARLICSDLEHPAYQLVFAVSALRFNDKPMEELRKTTKAGCFFADGNHDIKDIINT